MFVAWTLFRIGQQLPQLPQGGMRRVDGVGKVRQRSLVGSACPAPVALGREDSAVPERRVAGAPGVGLAPLEQHAQLERLHSIMQRGIEVSFQQAQLGTARQRDEGDVGGTATFDDRRKLFACMAQLPGSQRQTAPNQAQLPPLVRVGLQRCCADVFCAPQQKISAAPASFMTPNSFSEVRPIRTTEMLRLRRRSITA